MGNKSKRNVYHVTSNSDKGWKVKKLGASQPSRYFITWKLIRPSDIYHPVIPANWGIQ